MAENWDTNTRYPLAAPIRNYFMRMINPNFSAATYGSFYAPPSLLDVEKVKIDSPNLPSAQTEFFDQDGGRTNFGAATFFKGEISSIEGARFMDNNEGYVGYRGHYHSNEYHPILHNHEKFLYASYSDERKSYLEELVCEFVNESKRMEALIDEEKTSLEDLCCEFATSLSKRMDYNEKKMDDLELHLVNLGTKMKNHADQVCQLATAVNVRTRENFIDDDDEEIDSTPTFDEFIPSEYEEGRNGKEERYDFLDNIYNLCYPQHHTHLLLEFQSNQALENFKKLPTNNCFVDIEVVAHDEAKKRKWIDELEKWPFKEQEPSGKENWTSVARGQHDDLSTMGWSIDNIIGETLIVKVYRQQCLRRVKPKYTCYFDPP